MLALITHPSYSYSFPQKHRFPMQKFALLYAHLANKGIAQHSNTVRPGPAKHELLTLAHCPKYVSDFCQGTLDAKALRRIGLPWSKALVHRSLISPAGSWLAALFALKYGLACHLAGGTHHAHYDFGSGFCIFNDLAITALALIRSKRAKKVLIFDCDVHQGDGTATLLAAEANIITCSIHCEKNFPVRKACSDIDVELPKGMSDMAYLQQVENTLQHCLSLKPDFIIYDAGVDVYQHDPLGLLDISIDGIRARDAMVVAAAVGAGIPLMSVIGGGYDSDELALAARHAIIAEEVYAAFQRRSA